MNRGEKFILQKREFHMENFETIMRKGELNEKKSGNYLV